MSDAIQSFEDEHEAFAASRVSQYVYVPAKETYFTTLDQHADTLEGDVKLPLVLLGNEGSGKSAFLANWVAKRREHRHRDEFLFQHFVGCSTPSLQLAHTLFRLETALKDFFQLREMKVPDTEEGLRWGLNRFLAAAAKKHFPARIVIIIDGINRLKAEGAPDGALHWLPTELPPCVRFILSSVEYERVAKGSKEVPLHRTFIELSRRQCPIVRMESLGVETRHRVISTYTATHQGCVELTEGQLYKVVTANATSQPMFLRALLQALRIASRLTTFSVDQLLDVLLLCQAAVDLVDKNLNLCCDAIFGPATHGEKDNSAEREILGKVFSVVYVSRNGLTRDEIWGLMKMVTKIQLEESVEEKVMTVLAEFTMVVNNMHSFSHEVYRELVYDKYIKSHEALTRWHHFMARFFGQLPPVDRKLVALPYHLEVAGQWSKVKNCLTDIEMFQLWWTLPFKTDFIKFWVSLTKQVPSAADKKKANKQNRHLNSRSSRRGNSANGTGQGATSGGGGSATGGGGENSSERDLQANRPSYDIVEEYVKSLDEYRAAKHPSDEEVADIILKVADFLLEFATLGHEEAADVPHLIHPKILPADLKAMGVPHIDTAEDGSSLLWFPTIFEELGVPDDGTGVADNAPTKAKDSIPDRTVYFFSRWMWIQFPYIAIGSCSKRYSDGIQKFQESNTEANGRVKKPSEDEGMIRTSMSAGLLKKKETSSVKLMSKSWNVDTMKLPELKFQRKAARSVRKLTPFDLQDESKANADKFTQRLVALQDDIQCYREEYDFVAQMKGSLSKRLYELKGMLEDLKRSGESVEVYNAALADAVKREAEAAEKAASGITLRKNLTSLVTMCDRHPANVPPLIHEIEAKIEQDKFLIHEIKKRLWEQQFEKLAHVSKFREMKGLVQEGVDMHNKLLEYRYKMKRTLAQQANEDQRIGRSGSLLQSSASSSKRDKGMRGMGEKSEVFVEDDKWLIKQGQSWQDMWNVISTRTGIIEPEIFFQRLNNGSVLEDQINTLKKASEAKLESLKKDVVELEAELEEVRYKASVAVGHSAKEQKKELLDKQGNLRHIKERSEAAQQLVQNLQGGLQHIAETLGLSTREDDAPVGDLLRDIEAVLETLMEEREKQQQQQQQLHGHSQSQSDAASRAHTSVARDNPANVETQVHRSPELEAVLAKYEVPKARLPRSLPSKPADYSVGSSRSREDDDADEEEGMWDRTFVKTQSTRNVRAEQKKAARQSKIATDEAHMAATA